MHKSRAFIFQDLVKENVKWRDSLGAWTPNRINQSNVPAGQHDVLQQKLTNYFLSEPNWPWHGTARCIEYRTVFSIDIPVATVATVVPWIALQARWLCALTEALDAKRRKAMASLRFTDELVGLKVARPDCGMLHGPNQLALFPANLTFRGLAAFGMQVTTQLLLNRKLGCKLQVIGMQLIVLCLRSFQPVS